MRAWLAKQGVRRTEPEFELQDALRQPGCPICRLALRTVARQLDIVSYEAVNDLDVRARLRAARGFCNHHAWQFLEETRDPLGTALVYRDVINTLVGLLVRSSPAAALIALRDGLLDALPIPGAGARGRRRPCLAQLGPTLGCPACAARRETEDLYLRLLGGHLHERGFLDAWAGSDGLCWPHLLQCLAQVTDERALTALVEGRHLPSLLDPHSSLPAEFGHLDAERAALPPPLVVDVQRRRLEEVNRPGAPGDVECPACRPLVPVLTALLSEVVRGADPHVLDRLCGRHAWELLDADAEVTGLGRTLADLKRWRDVALVAELAEIRRAPPGWLPSERGPAAVGRRLAERLRPEGECPLCEAQAEADAHAVEAVLGEWQTFTPPSAPLSRFAGEGLGVRGALCLPHLLLADRGAVGREGWAAMLAHQAAAWRALSADLAEYIRKHDYRFRLEPRGPEQASPWRAVELIAGPKGRWA